MTESGSQRRPVLWERMAAVGRGRKASLSHDAIAREATRIADANGLDAVTMRRLAKELGVGTMSLYRYVESRDEVVDLMIDGALGEITYAEPTSASWRAALTELAHLLRRTGLRHPWLGTQAIGRPAMGPQTLRMIEQTLARVDVPGLTIDQMLDMETTVSQFVMGYVMGELAGQEARRRTGLTEQQWRARYGPYLMDVLDRGQHPYMKRVIVDAEDFPDTDVVFERRLGYILDGLASGLGLDGR